MTQSTRCWTSCACRWAAGLGCSVSTHAAVLPPSSPGLPLASLPLLTLRPFALLRTLPAGAAEWPGAGLGAAQPPVLGHWQHQRQHGGGAGKQVGLRVLGLRGGAGGRIAGRAGRGWTGVGALQASPAGRPGWHEDGPKCRLFLVEGGTAKCCPPTCALTPAPARCRVLVTVTCSTCPEASAWPPALSNLSPIPALLLPAPSSRAGFW